MEDNTAGNMIREINDELERNANNVLRKEDMTLSQIGLLLQLQAAPEGYLSISDIGKKLHIAQPTATGLVSRLEKKQLVEVVEDPSDKRIRNICLTKEGRKCCEEGEAHMRNTEARLLRSLDEEEKKQLLCLLQRVRDDLLTAKEDSESTGMS